MDMLANYGSDADSDDAEQLEQYTVSKPASARGGAVQAAHGNNAAVDVFLDTPTHLDTTTARLPSDFFDARGTIDAAPRNSMQHDGPDVGPVVPTEILRRKKGGTEIEDMPAPSGALLAKLPAPSKRIVKLPFKSKLLLGLASQRAAELGPDVEEEARPSKRPKPSTASKLTEFLPPPKFDRTAALGGGAALDGGAGAAPPRHKKRTAGSDSEEELDGVTAAGIGFSFSNEPYRADEGEGGDGDEDVAAAPGPAAGPPRAEGVVYGQHAAAAYAQDDGLGQSYSAAGQHDTTTSYSAYQGYAGYDGGGTSYGAQQYASYGVEQGADATLAAALKEEAERAARRGEPSAGPIKEIKFKEVNAKQLKHMDQSQKESYDALRQALGADYAAGLRSSAAPFAGNKLARSKHQIGTLFHNARMKELEMLEQRAKGMKQKAETQAKYGW